ncbi:MAG: YfhO family protein [Anaerolineae bacterium]|nr:YfhO family protein [Anaerolineae bacterium]MDW8070461.1 YfhO family protein [Anaerolineae bacterium]
MTMPIAHRFAPIAFLILLPLLVFWRLIFAGEVLYWGVPLTQFYPWHTLINQALAAGQLPLWTDLLGNGAPLLANHQTAFFYPPNLLLRLLPVEHALGYLVVLHIIGAGLAAWMWGRMLRLDNLGCSVLALSYALGGYVVGRTQFITMVAAYAWLPLLLALTERLIRQRSATNIIWLGGALGLQFLAGHAQTWFYSVVLLLLYGLYRARSPRPVLMILLAIVVALGLAAVQVLPTAELTLHSQRTDGVDHDFAMTYSYWPWRLLTLLAPDLYGNPALGNYVGYANYWEDHAYIGVLPLLLALLAIARWGRHCARRRGQADTVDVLEGWGAGAPQPFFAALGVLAVVLAMGKHTPLYPLLFHNVPGFNFFQAPTRLMLWFAISASTLAGIGVHRFWLSYRLQYGTRLMLAGAVAVFVVAWVARRGGLAPPQVYTPALERMAVLLALACGVLLLRGRAPDDPDTRVAISHLPQPVWQVLIVVLVAADLAIAAMPLTPTISAALYHTANPVAAVLDSGVPSRLHVDAIYQYDLMFNRYFTFKWFGRADLTYWQSLRTSLLPNLNVVDGIACTGNNDPLVVERWRNLLERTQLESPPRAERLLRLMNVGFVLTRKPLAPDWQAVDGVPHLYRLPAPWPRAWLVEQSQVISDAGQVLVHMSEPEFDPRVSVLLEEPLPLPTSPTSQRVMPNAVHGSLVDPPALSLREEFNRRTIRLTTTRPAYLVLAYTYYPGWHATVDGQAVALVRANYAFMALPLPGGSREVVLQYRPSSLLWGAWISGLTIGVLVGVIVYRSRAQRGCASPRGTG